MCLLYDEPISSVTFYIIYLINYFLYTNVITSISLLYYKLLLILHFFNLKYSDFLYCKQIV